MIFCLYSINLTIHEHANIIIYFQLLTRQVLLLLVHSCQELTLYIHINVELTDVTYIRVIAKYTSTHTFRYHISNSLIIQNFIVIMWCMDMDQSQSNAKIDTLECIQALMEFQQSSDNVKVHTISFQRHSTCVQYKMFSLYSLKLYLFLFYW